MLLVAGVAASTAGCGASDHGSASPEATAADGQRASPTATPTETPEPYTLTVGNPRTIRVRRGETVSFTVRSGNADVLRIEGHTLRRRLRADRTTSITVRHPAEAGTFRISLERTGERVGTLRVRP